MNIYITKSHNTGRTSDILRPSKNKKQKLENVHLKHWWFVNFTRTDKSTATKLPIDSKILPSSFKSQATNTSKYFFNMIKNSHSSPSINSKTLQNGHTKLEKENEEEDEEVERAVNPCTKQK